MINVRPRNIHLTIIAALMMSLLAISTVQPTEAAASRKVNTTGGAAACSLPLVHDRYIGFHVGVPAGWTMSTRDGAVIVSKDPVGTEMGLIYPALLTRGLTPARYFAIISADLRRSVVATGTTINFRMIASPSQLPQAIVSGRTGRVSEEGHAAILLLPDSTALATRQIVFFLYWAPAARLAHDAPWLSGIGACYGPEPGTLYRWYQDQNYVAPIPLSWSVSSSQQNELVVMGDGHRAAAAYILATVPANAHVKTARLLRQYLFAQLHIQIDTIFSAIESSGTKAASGGTITYESLEFTGKYNGKLVHAVASIACATDAAYTSGVLRLAMADAGQWFSTSAALMHVAMGIERDLQYNRALNAPVSQFQAEFTQVGQPYSDVTTDVQVVEDTATGTYYQAPFNCFVAQGPAGPGYYLERDGKEVRLKIVGVAAFSPWGDLP